LLRHQRKLAGVWILFGADPAAQKGRSKLHRKTRATGREYFVPRLRTDDMRGVIKGVKAYLPL